MRIVAKVLSVLLHPLWMPTFTIVLCFGLDPFLRYGLTKDGLLIVYGMVFCMSGLFPLMSALMMRRTGLLTDITMPLRQERLPVYLTTLLYYAMCYYLLRRTSSHPMVLSLFFGGGVALFVLMLITVRWKMSAHMVGIGGLVGSVLAVMAIGDREATLVLCILFVLAGALGTARLLTSDHTPAQVYAGAVLGCVCVFGCVWGGVAI